MFNLLLYAVLPYVAFFLFVIVSIQRYRKNPFTFSSLSSQFLETKELFWGSVPFHFGILTLFAGHFFGFLFPRSLTLWGRVPIRLFILEATGLAAAFLTLAGLLGLIVRRASNDRLRAVTSPADVLVFVLLFFQIVTGLWVALGLRWGSAWYGQVVVPYLWSLVRLQPDIQRMVDLKLAAQVHIVGAFVFFAVFSFTRLVHVLVAPVPYLWRRNQVVIWNRPRKQGI